MLRQTFGHTLKDSQTTGMSELPLPQVGLWKLRGRAEKDRYRVIIEGPDKAVADVTIKTAREFLGKERRVG